MAVLTRETRQRLLAALAQVPNLETAEERTKLLTGLPPSLVGNIPRERAKTSDLLQIITICDGWLTPAGAGDHPLHQVITNGLILSQGVGGAAAVLRALRDTLPWNGEGPPPLAICPYKGLHTFQEADAALFFGRDAYITKLVAAVQAQPLVAVVGPSGTGKSSVVYAGLLPALRDQPGWVIPQDPLQYAFRPGPHPFDALVAALLPQLEPDRTETERVLVAGRVVAALRAGTLALNTMVRRIIQRHAPSTVSGVSAASPRLLLIADQFEEVFTLCSDAQEREQFIAVLLTAIMPNAAGPSPPLTLVVTLRADFFGQALTVRPLADALQTAQLNLGSMTVAELEAAICGPAAVADLDLESGLAARIVADVTAAPGQLPLLEFALFLLWQRDHPSGVLTHAAYTAIGQVAGALAGYADGIYSRLAADRQATARRLFVQLVQPGVGTADTRRLAHTTDLDPAAAALLPQLADDRLLITGRDPAGAPTVEVVHEALITGWGRLRGWMVESREFRTWQERLRQARREWEQGRQDPDLLLRGAALSTAEEWLSKRADALPAAEQDFITRSVAARDAAQIAAERARVRETRRNRGTALGFAALAVLAIIGAIVAQNNAQLADTARATAVADKERADTNAHQAATAVVQADDSARQAQAQARAARREQAEAAGLQAQQVQEEYTQRRLLLAVESASITSAHDEPVAVQADQALWATLSTSRGRVLPGHKEPLIGEAISADGRWLATADQAGEVRLWDLQGADPATSARIMSTDLERLTRIAFSPDAQWVVVVGTYAWAWRFNDAQAAPLHLGSGQGGVKALAFSPSSQYLYTAGVDQTVRRWDLRADDPAADDRIVARDEGEIEGLAISPDGRWLATGGRAAAARVWNLSDDAPVKTPIVLQMQSWVWSVTFNHDGSLLGVSDSTDNNAFWDFAAQPPTIKYNLSQSGNQHLGYVPQGSVAFSHDGQWAITGNHGTLATVWDMRGTFPVRYRTLGGHKPGTDITDVAISPDGRWVATGGVDGLVLLWDLLAGQDSASQTLLGHEDRIFGVTFSPDSRTLITSSWDRTVRIWELNALPTHVASRLLVDLSAGSRSVGATVDPEGRWLVMSDTTGTTVRDLSAPDAQVVTTTVRGPSGPLTQVALSVDGRRLLGIPERNPQTVQVWDLSDHTTPHLIYTLADHAHPITTLALSPNGRWALTGGPEMTTRLWELGPDAAHLPTYQEVHAPPSVHSATFSANGQWLVIGDQDAGVWVFATNDVTKPAYQLQTQPNASNGSNPVMDVTKPAYQLQTQPNASNGSNPVMAVAISAKGSWVAAVARRDYLTYLWDLHTSQPVAYRLEGFTDLNTQAGDDQFYNQYSAITAIGFSADEQWLGVLDDRSIIQLWDLTVTNPTAAPRILHTPSRSAGDAGWASALAFTPDGRWLVTISGAAVRRWPLQLGERITLACAAAGRNLTEAEWRFYFGSTPYHASCPNWPAKPPGPAHRRGGPPCFVL